MSIVASGSFGGSGGAPNGMLSGDCSRSWRHGRTGWRRGGGGWRGGGCRTGGGGTGACWDRGGTCLRRPLGGTGFTRRVGCSGGGVRSGGGRRATRSAGRSGGHPGSLSNACPILGGRYGHSRVVTSRDGP
ncbi:hypothetical protein GCM10017566_33880 [Amycolatopsis bartoniae]|uniref:Uncharacterized protein n=1 Tax=Amycolatopsis bartoniae TaxID=941986 RepID=A0A8H9ITH0_9PSEU|nr:hypothetical protein GCM10017566_33880 [Amycolatopsis bartoniae]